MKTSRITHMSLLFAAVTNLTWCLAETSDTIITASTPTPPIVQSRPLRFEERLILDNYGYAYGIAAADLDSDGDIDLTSSDTVNDKLYWFENDEKGN